MEEKERKKIRENMDILIGLTECSHMLMATLLRKEILGSEDVDSLSAETKMMARCYNFYEILVTRAGAFNHLLQALRETGQTDVLEILETTGSRESESRKMELASKRNEQILKKALKRCRVMGDAKSSTSFCVRDPTTLFTGREEELSNLHKLILSSTSTTDGSKPVISHVSVSGLGGIGKTQLARKYVQVYGPHFDNNVIWIDASSEESLIHSFRQLASNVLGVSIATSDGKNRDIIFIVNDCYQYFSTCKSIFVFDNADKGDYISRYFPNNTNGGGVSILITSRVREWGKSVKVFDLKVFREEEAIDFVKKGLSNSSREQEDTIADIKLLTLTLHYFPLALQQAASYIEDERVTTGEYGIGEYLHELEKNDRELLDSQVADDLRADYARTTFNTWRVTVDKIAKNAELGKIAIDILELIAFFHPDGIPRETLVHLNYCTERQLKLAVRLLIKFSMIDGYEHQSMLSIHRLVQHVIKIDLRAKNDTANILENALHIFETHLNVDNTKHAISVWRHAVNFPHLIKGFSGIPPDIGFALTDKYCFEEAIAFGMEALENLCSVLDENDYDILAVEINLVTAYNALCKYEIACEMQKRVCVKNAIKFGPNSVMASRGFYMYGLCLWTQCKFTEGFQLCYTALLKTEKAIDVPDSLLLSQFMEVAQMATSLGEYRLAENLLQRLPTVEEDTEGHCNVETHITKMRLANMRAETGMADGLETLRNMYAQIDFNKDYSWEMQLYIWQLLAHLKIHLLQYKCFDEGYEVSQNCHKICQQWFGKSDLRTVASLNEVGFALLMTGRVDEALKIFEQAYVKLKLLLGSNSPVLSEALSYQGLALSYLGKHEKAIYTSLEAFDVSKGTLANDDIHYLKREINYAVVLERAGCCDEALQVYKGIRDKWAKKFGQLHPYYLDCVSSIRMLEFKILFDEALNLISTLKQKIT